MTRKVSRVYETHKSFRREVERRFGAEVPDDVWEEKGASTWRAQAEDPGYAVESAVTSVLVGLRHIRRSGRLPPAPPAIQREPTDAWRWRLRSLFLSRLVEQRAAQWRSRFLPVSLDQSAYTLRGSSDGIVSEGRTGCLTSAEFGSWIKLLVETRGSDYLGLPRATGAPAILVSGPSAILLSFPSSIAPRFLKPSGLPTAWWSGSDSETDTEVSVAATMPGGSVSELNLNHWGRRTLETLASEANGIRRNRWSLAEAAGFFLFGAVPLLSPMRATRSRTWDQLGRTTRIQLDVDSRVSPADVASFFRDVAASDATEKPSFRRLRPFSEKVSTLLELALQNWLPEGRLNWKALWRDWQAGAGSKPGWGYASPSTIARVVQRAIDKLTDELNRDPTG